MTRMIPNNIARGRRAGLSLVEALISLAITAILLTAVGVAYQAASAAVDQNDQFFRASQAARVSINMIMADVRKCTSGAISNSGATLTLDVAGTGSSDIQTVAYSFDSTSDTLTRTGTHPDGSTDVSTLAHYVSAVEFDTESGASAGTTISMAITVQVGNNQILLNSSAMPRRKVVYQ